VGSVRVAWNLIRVTFGAARSSFRTKRELALENLALVIRSESSRVLSVIGVLASGTGTALYG